MYTATDLLKIMLESGWNLRLQSSNQFIDNNEENNKDIEERVKYLCHLLAQDEYDHLPFDEVKEKIFDLAVKNIKQNVFKHRENWYLFDYKGRPICAIPNKFEGLAFCNSVEIRHGIYLGFGNYFESTKQHSLKRWEKLVQTMDNPSKLKRRIWFYRLTTA